MDANVQLYLLVVLAVAIQVLFFISRRRAAGDPHAKRQPPGPWALPLIGHLHHLAGAVPHRALHALARRHGPLMSLRLGELEAVVASSPDAAREIMKVHDTNFASRPLTSMLQLAYQGNEGLVFAPYGDGWRQLRRICKNELLSSRSVQSFRHVREEELGRLLSSVAAAACSGTPVNLTKGMSAYLADSTVRAVIGSRFKQRDRYLRALQDMLSVVPGMTLPDLFPSWRLALLLSSVPGRIMRHSKDLKQMMDTIIQERRAAGQVQDEDFLDVLLRLQTEMDSQYPLTTENIKTVLLVNNLDSFFLIHPSKVNQNLLSF
jgi:cytochrome P450